MPATTSAAADSSDDDGTQDDDDGTFLLDLDMGPSPFECDPWEQDCAAGEKCMAWNGGEGMSWDATRCAAIVANPDQIGEPCEAFGGQFGGLDSCDANAICFYVDPQTNMGSCIGTCTGDPTTPQCEQPNASCVIGGEPVLLPCMPHCHPLLDDCSESQACSPWVDIPICVPTGDVEVGEPCEYIGQCVAAAFCAQFGDCGGNACCTAWCDLTGGEPNPSCDTQAAETCLPYYPPGEAPAGYDDVGYCGVDG